MDKIIVNFAPTGLIPGKKENPHTPISVSEITEEVLMAYEMGISMVHLHARDEKSGAPCYKMETYAKIIENIRKDAPDLVIGVSTSGRFFSDIAKRMEVLELTGRQKPDMASLTLSSLNFNKQESVNSPEHIQMLAQGMKKRQIKPELEAFDTGMINYAKYLAKKGWIEPPYYFNLIFGNIACAQADLLHTAVMINELPDESFYSLGGVGNAQLKMNSLGIAMGCGIRIGMEDNYWYDANRRVLATNRMLLQRIHSIAKANERTLMSPSELRLALGLKKGYGEYGKKY
ncbi:3-keto-5-aminohexanoate cleavage protein [Clostridia bacterium]|nr:3-keto-5-aminohexanoate cleavage protein [Clostridia bacterium]